MAKIEKEENKKQADKKTHMGYNEKNPTQPQGAFKPNSMEPNDRPIHTSVVKKRRTKKISLPK